MLRMLRLNHLSVRFDNHGRLWVLSIRYWMKRIAREQGANWKWHAVQCIKRKIQNIITIPNVTEWLVTDIRTMVRVIDSLTPLLKCLVVDGGILKPKQNLRYTLLTHILSDFRLSVGVCCAVQHSLKLNGEAMRTSGQQSARAHHGVLVPVRVVPNMYTSPHITYPHRVTRLLDSCWWIQQQQEAFF